MALCRRETRSALCLPTVLLASGRLMAWQVGAVGLTGSLLSRPGRYCALFLRPRGEVPEWSNGAVSKTVVPYGYRGFESHPLRHLVLVSENHPELRA